MAQQFYVGDVIHFTGTFAAGDGTPADPTIVVFSLRKAAEGIVQEFDTASTPAVEHNGAGAFSIDVPVDVAGSWYWRWQGTGAVEAVDEGRLSVRESAF